MKHKLELAILPQPNATTCGPTCLHAMYRFLGDDVTLETVIDETHKIEAAAGGGTYSVFLAIHALRRGYKATIHTFNLRVFDPTWFALSNDAMIDRLTQRRDATTKPRLRMVMQGFLDFLSLGGELLFEDLTTGLIRKYLNRGAPILTGLSSTYLYRTMRERSEELPDGNVDLVDDDIRGEPQGHFVVLCGYDKSDRSVLVADPWTPNPAFQGLQYVVNIDRVLCAVLLGALTNDADLLIIEPPEASRDDAPSDQGHELAEAPGRDDRGGSGGGNGMAGSGGGGDVVHASPHAQHGHEHGRAAPREDRD